eukprot:6212458-Pleurochrysis_carterae.AAC.2
MPVRSISFVASDCSWGTLSIDRTQFVPHIQRVLETYHMRACCDAVTDCYNDNFRSDFILKHVSRFAACVRHNVQHPTALLSIQYDNTALGSSAATVRGRRENDYYVLVLIPTVNGRGAGAGAGAWRTYGAARGRERSLGKGGHREQGSESLGRAPQVCMRCESKTANRACECQLQMQGARDDNF